MNRVSALVDRARQASRGGFKAGEAALRPLLALLGDVTAADCGLCGADMPREGAVRYMEVWEDDDISIGIPLHDHPRMTVLSNVLLGAVEVHSFDLDKPISDFAPERLVAYPCAPHTLRAPTVTHLLPDRGNLHEFRADGQHGCAILDVILPPYNPVDGRACTYYQVQPMLNGGESRGAGGGPGGDAATAAAGAAAEQSTVADGRQPVLLVAVEPPADFFVQREEYTGLDPTEGWVEDSV